jgi:hypothetical protein
MGEEFGRWRRRGLRGCEGRKEREEGAMASPMAEGMGEEDFLPVRTTRCDGLRGEIFGFPIT